MRKIIFIQLACISISFPCFSQKNDGKVLWAFPITGYMLPLNDSMKVVQVVLPANLHFVLDKQLGLLRGISRGEDVDTASKGWGKCHLIKGEYNYFSILLEKDKQPREGDLVYTFIPELAGNYRSPIFYCAEHAITFKTVDDTAFYNPEGFLKIRTKTQDITLTNKMAADIRRTGKYYLENDTTLNKPIEDGTYKGRRMLDIMAEAKVDDVNNFLNYVAARPRRYAGNTWKISETFATWLMSGAPMVVEH